MTEPFLDEEGVPTADPTAFSTTAGDVESAVDNSAGAAGGRRRRAFLLPFVIAAIAALGLAVTSAVLASKLNSERDDRRAVQDVSGRFAAALLTYDYTDLNAAKSRVLALSTGNFKKQYEQAFTGGLDTLFKETQARSAGSVTDVFVGDISEGTVTTIAVVDAVARGTGGSRRLMSSYIELNLVKVHGAWKVDGVTNLNLGAASSDTGGLSGATTTTTTATTAPPK